MILNIIVSDMISCVMVSKLLVNCWVGGSGVKWKLFSIC